MPAPARGLPQSQPRPSPPMRFVPSRHPPPYEDGCIARVPAVAEFEPRVLTALWQEEAIGLRRRHFVSITSYRWKCMASIFLSGLDARLGKHMAGPSPAMTK